MYDKKRLALYFEDTKVVVKDSIERNLKLPSSKSIVSLIGARRTGKTYLFYQKIATLPKEQVILLEFENPVLSRVTVDEFGEIISQYVSLYKASYDKKLYIFIDEPQVLHNWEIGIRYLHDTFDCELYITGSSSKLLSKEIATSLRGRNISFYLYPLSFVEFLRFKGEGIMLPLDTKKKGFVLNLFREFLLYGGFPQVVLAESELEKKQILKNYYDLVVFKDIVDRYNLKNTNLIRYLIEYVVSANTKVISIHKLFKTLQSQGFKVAKNTLYDYYSILADVFFIVSLKKHSFSVRRQELSFEKPFLIDVGYMSLFSMEDYGKRLENVVCVELQRRRGVHDSIFFTSDNSFECDFLIKEGAKITKAIQVCYELNDDNEKREIAGLVEACKTYKLKEGLLLTYDHEDSFQKDGITIEVKPVWKWLLST
ncbi:MAG: ATP-binding protein [Candidatus Woesearchaeota archaeon]